MPPEKLTVTDTGIAPYIYFEGAPNFGFANGVVNITLAANRWLLRNGAPVRDVVATAHLRCNVPAALELRNALDAALLLAARPQGGAREWPDALAAQSWIGSAQNIALSGD